MTSLEQHVLEIKKQFYPAHSAGYFGGQFRLAEWAVNLMGVTKTQFIDECDKQGLLCSLVGDSFIISLKGT